MYKKSHQDWVKHLDFIILDMLCLILSYILAFLIRHGSIRGMFEKQVYVTIGVAYLIFDLLIVILGNTFHNVVRRGRFNELIGTIKQDTLLFAGVTIFLFTTKDGDQVSRLVLWITLILHIISGFGVRMLWKQVISNRAADLSKRSMILVADRTNVSRVLQCFKDNPAEGLAVKGIVVADQDLVGQEIFDIPIVSTLADAPKYICHEWIDEVYISTAVPPRQLIERCFEMGVTVHRELSLVNGGQQVVEKMAGMPVLTSSMKIATPMQMFLKRSMDIAGGLIGSLLALVIIAIVGPKIKKASPGPILFKQERIGMHGKHFTLLKIRSMHLDAEERKAELMRENRVSHGMMFKLDFDPRIIGNEVLPDGSHKTGIGAFIRKTSLDEFPQFFCVLKGDMSLVGTRPPTLDEWERYEYHHRARLAIKPGITGMWQISGRSRVTDFEEVVELDKDYINNWTLWMDIKMILKTIVIVAKGEGAM